jgi:hypothetical protein
VSGKIELIYNRLVAAEKLKNGTKYERLAAIAFRQITGRAVLHDLRLRGASGAPHQIDAVVGDGRKRVLVEAKDYDKKVDLPIVRNFWAEVEDLKPDEAFVVTTVGYSYNAVKYASAKGIRLALLRPPHEDDWDGLVRRKVLEFEVTAQAGPPAVTWHVHPDDHDKVDEEISRRLVETAELMLVDVNDHATPFEPMLDEQLKAEYAKVPLGGAAKLGRANQLTEPTWLHAPGISPLLVDGWTWEADVVTTSFEHVIGDGVGGLSAELVLRSLDGSLHTMVTNRQILSWTFDGNAVVPRPGSSASG